MSGTRERHDNNNNNNSGRGIACFMSDLAEVSEISPCFVVTLPCVICIRTRP